MDSTSVSLLRRLHDPAEESAWERFVELYTPMMLYWAKRRGLSMGDASDLVQDVLLTLIAKIRDYNPDIPGRFRGWLRTVTLNRVNDFHRKSQRRPTTNDSSQLQTAVDDHDDLFLEESEYRQRLLVRALELVQASFEASTWQAGLAQIVDRQTARQVADQLGITVNAAYIAKSRVLDRLRIELEGLWD